eukprot:gene30112-36373_t
MNAIEVSPLTMGQEVKKSRKFSQRTATLAGYSSVLVLLAWSVRQAVIFTKKFWYRLPAILYRLRNPVHPYRDIVWKTSDYSEDSVQVGGLPNIILIVADDLGINDLQGGAGVATPNIDSLHQNGVHFTTAYAGHATCAPSRAAIFTGRIPTTMGFEFTPTPMVLSKAMSVLDSADPNTLSAHFDSQKARQVPRMGDMVLPRNFTTIAEQLKHMHYRNYLIGKWHLGDSAGHSALERGFDETLTFPVGMSAYGKQTDPDIITLGLNGSMAHFDEFMRYSLPFTVSHNNQEHFEPNEYLTDYLSQRAVDLIHAQKRAKAPFFLSLTYTAPHSPLQCTRQDFEALGHIADPTKRVYAAMVRALDRGVGEVLQALKDTDQHRNTLLIFTSDNGAAHYVGLPESNYPFRGWKATLFEGGVRVPLFMQWEGVVKPGGEVQHPVSHVDVYATIFNAAAGKYSSLSREDDRSDEREIHIDMGDVHGKDLLQHVAKENNDGTLATDYASQEASVSPPHEYLFWRSGHYKAIRYRDWKMQVSTNPHRVWLHNLLVDPTEQHNLAYDQHSHSANSTQVHAMQEVLMKKLLAIDEQQAKPLWPSVLSVPMPIDKTAMQHLNYHDEHVYWSN